jgi:hypothetical protein
MCAVVDVRMLLLPVKTTIFEGCKHFSIKLATNPFFKKGWFELNLNIRVMYTLHPFIDQLPDHNPIHFLLLKNLIHLLHFDSCPEPMLIFILWIAEGNPYLFFICDHLIIFGWTNEIMICCRLTFSAEARNRLPE